MASQAELLRQVNEVTSLLAATGARSNIEIAADTTALMEVAKKQGAPSEVTA